MAKLIIVVLALAFTALVAFASAHHPTLIEEGNSIYSKQQCSQQLQGQRLNRCQSYISSTWSENPFCCSMVGCLPCMINSEGEQELYKQGQGLEECCNELKNVEEECQCEAMQEVYKQAQEQQWSQQSSQQPQTRALQQIVQNLSNQCNLQVQQCRIPSAAMF